MVEVSHACDAPAVVDRGDKLAGQTRIMAAFIGHPDVDAAIDVAPQDVRLAVLVEIADARHTPTAVDRASILADKAGVARAWPTGHPDIDVTTTILPENRGFAPRR